MPTSPPPPLPLHHSPDQAHDTLGPDVEFLGITAAHEDGPGAADDRRSVHRTRFVVEEHLARLDGRLYGGTAIAASVVAAELLTERPVTWMTTQFVSTVERGTPITMVSEILAPGHRTNQVRISGLSPTGAIVFASLGASGHPRAEGLSGSFETMPTVAAPDRSEPWESPFTGMAAAAGLGDAMPPLPERTGFTTVIELRHAPIERHPDEGPGRVALWVRRRDGQPISPAVAAFVADMVPMAVARGCGVVAFGTSLDNTIRVGAGVPTEWVLIDLRAHHVSGDYGHGLAHVWTERGELLATASQTAAMRAIDLDQLPWADSTS